MQTNSTLCNKFARRPHINPMTGVKFSSESQYNLLKQHCDFIKQNNITNIESISPPGVQNILPPRNNLGTIRWWVSIEGLAGCGFGKYPHWRRVIFVCSAWNSYWKNFYPFIQYFHWSDQFGINRFKGWTRLDWFECWNYGPVDFSRCKNKPRHAAGL